MKCYAEQILVHARVSVIVINSSTRNEYVNTFYRYAIAHLGKHTAESAFFRHQIETSRYIDIAVECTGVEHIDTAIGVINRICTILTIAPHHIFLS